MRVRLEGATLAGAMFWASLASAQRMPLRGLLAREVQRAVPGGELVLRVQTPTGLTPPPGVQQERALLGFGARLCLHGAAPPACRALVTRDVRPLDAHSLDYRVKFSLPRDLPLGRHDLELRVPGGSDRFDQGVVVDALPARTPAPAREAASGPTRAMTECRAVPGARGPWAMGLLVVVLSWKLGAGRRARARRWNSARRTSVSRGP